jgi:pyruvate/2-oxoglutarate dehydrogenase complex dihydrolipoamide acyltransferase (E2) component
MAITIRKENETMTHYVADSKMWLNADRTKVLEDGDPDAAHLFATPGKRISVEDAELYGLTNLEREENPKEVKPGENKMVAGPSATKAAAAKAEELGVALSDVEGTGKDGNITVADIQAVAPPPAPVEKAAPAPVEKAPKAPAKAPAKGKKQTNQSGG